jgi:hypothetical protein
MVNTKFIVGIFAIVFLGVGTVSAQTYTDAEARGILRDIGVEVNYTEPRTSLNGIRHATLTEIIDLAQASHASIIITGGTESGYGDKTHNTGNKSHVNGYKVDLRLTSSLNSHLEYLQ